MKTKEEKKDLIPQVVDETLLPTMTADGVVAQRALIKDVVHRVMKKDVHYGVIPGTEKPTLYKPGAEVLCLTFRLSPVFESREVMDGNHMTVFSRCSLTHIPSGRTFGSGEAVCSTKEKKYAKRKDAGRVVDNMNLPDSWNTVTKIGNKRALIAAVLVATAASDEFTQDMGDGDEKPEEKEPLVVPDTDPTPEPEAQPPKKKPKKDNGFLEWIGLIGGVEEGELPGGTKMWAISTENESEQSFKTTDGIFAEIARQLHEKKQEAVIHYSLNSRKSLVIEGIQKKGIQS